jgi:hypothetical protein
VLFYTPTATGEICQYCCARRATLTVFLYHLEFLQPPLETGRRDMFSQKDKKWNANCDSMKQVLSKQRDLESGKWKLSAGSVNTNPPSKEKWTDKH